jgi:hypothetical protein
VNESPLQLSQMTMARFLRDPDNCPPPAGVEARRLKIYQGLVYNNIEGFISSGFPVLRSLYDNADWHTLVRAFIDQHRCHTPYFLEISQEFLKFLMEIYQGRDCDPPFMAELAHYEWVELALDVSQEELPDVLTSDSTLDAVPALSPLAWLLSYRYPVHRIGPGFRPEESAEPTYLVVYRNRADQVRFMELNATTARLVELVRDNTGKTGRELLGCLAGELNTPVEAILEFGTEQIEQMHAESVMIAQKW